MSVELSVRKLHWPIVRKNKPEPSKLLRYTVSLAIIDVNFHEFYKYLSVSFRVPAIWSNERNDRTIHWKSWK